MSNGWRVCVISFDGVDGIRCVGLGAMGIWGYGGWGVWGLGGGDRGWGGVLQLCEEANCRRPRRRSLSVSLLVADDYANY